ncbi:hypothetical protein CGLO_03807 [Colletotrichum gloeosporioides Cg-14]|uniref:Uncharacterized protein n=1 Tax=Colletotrichum gloeosporioides (strain Cg-14) TaxID=1237896 RepID=T0KKS8_COLGC|nr:hypothetical protein CGLO_03807 [Colletotrichum gloeosporioides Cg-14]
MGIRQVARYAFVAVRDEKECGLRWGGNGFGTTRKPPLGRTDVRQACTQIGSPAKSIVVADQGLCSRLWGVSGEESQELY